MSKFFYSRLAFNNIKKNSKHYIPFIISYVLTVAMFYIIKSLSLNKGLEEMSVTAAAAMVFGCGVVALFAVIFLFYTNSFLIKRRKKEFGLYNILGMEKKHISKVIFIENIIVAIFSIFAGLIIGIALDKLMFLIITKILGGNAQLGFTITPQAIADTAILFAIIFLLLLINSIRIVYTTKTIELLHGGNIGEKEPKAKWFIALLGLLCLGIGYYISITVTDPTMALLLMFVAIILVIIGTYLIFTAGIITLLKLLKKNKRFYYKTSHFISTSGMIYRMKQNSVGLANICILSTMVLVMVSTTTSLMIGMNDNLEILYPYDLSFSLAEDNDDVNRAIKSIDDTLAEENAKVTESRKYESLAIGAVKRYNSFLFNESSYVDAVDSIAYVEFMTLNQFNKLNGENEELNDGEVLIYSEHESFDYSTIKIKDKEYKVAGSVSEFLQDHDALATIYMSYGIVVKDRATLEDIAQTHKKYMGENASPIKLHYDINVDADEKTQIDLFNKATDNLFNNIKYEGQAYCDCRAVSKNDFLGLYGGLFFLGILLGTLFIMATILLIYYKQISEGYDDKERYEIMQNVGMSHTEVKKSIHSQILTVFFLPLITAGIHVAFAFPIMSKILAMLGLVNTTLYIICTVACFLIFAAMYAIIYGITSKLYYKIVNKQQ